MIFERIVSIGQNCQAKHHILRKLWLDRFGSEAGFHINSNLFTAEEQSSLFFDWSWTKTPVDSISRVVKSGFTGILERDNLEIVRLASGREEVLDTATGLRYPHHFTREPDGRVLSDTVVREFEHVREKLHYLAEKTHRILQEERGNLLFVFYADCVNEDVSRLTALFEDAYPLLNFRILHVRNRDSSRFFDSGRVWHRNVRDQDYPGDADGWLAAFDGIEFKLGRSV